MRNGDTTVVYDVRPSHGAERVVAQRFAPDGSATGFDAPARQTLPRSKWLIARTQRCDASSPAQLLQTLEDTPFYVRSVLQSDLLGERVTSVHETLDVRRVASLPVRLMLPWRMPRRA
jgi:carotenoid 1,2-hydratase